LRVKASLRQNSESQLKKRNNTPLKDAKYRGRTAHRRDLFDEPQKYVYNSEKTKDGSESDEISEIEEEIAKDSVSGKSDEDLHDASESSDVSADEEHGQHVDQQQTRRDKVRKLLAQETR
jgi:hypothetical protein